MEKITVIMPCYIISEKLLELTQAAIASLGQVDTLIIVDNASLIGGGFLRSKGTIYIRNSENLGFAKAVNQGLKLADDDLIAIVNNDTRVSPNWQAVAKKVLVNPNTFSCHFRMTDYDEPFAYGTGTWYTGRERWCQGSFFVIDGKKKQLYDENFLNSYCDWDFLYRAREQGLATAYTNEACFQHHHSFTQQLIPNRDENNQQNAEYFKEKHGDYAEHLFAKQYPEQLAVDWKEGFSL